VSGMGRVLGLTFIAQLIIQLQGLIVMPIILRWAGPATYGAYTMLLVTTIFFFEQATSAIYYPYVRNLVSAATPVERRHLFEPQITFCLIVLAVISTALLLARPTTMDIGTGTSISTFLLVGVLAANLAQRTGLDYFRYTLRFVPYSMILGGPPLAFMLLLTTTVALQQIPSLDTLLILQCATGLGVSVPFVLAMIREIGIPRLRLPLTTLMRDARAGLPLTLDGLVNFSLGFSDRYLISLFLSVAAVGYYQPSYQAAAILFFVARLMSDILSPIASRMADLKQRTDAEDLVLDFFRLFLMIAVPFTVGMLMVGPSFLGLLTTVEIAETGRWVMPTVAAAVTVNGFVSFMRTVAVALHRVPTVLLARSTGALLNVALNLLLLPIFADIATAALSTLIGYSATCLYLVFKFRSSWRLPFDAQATLRFCIAATIMGTALWMIGYRPATVVSETIYHLSGTIALSIVVYFVALSVVGGFGRRELRQIATVFQYKAPSLSTQSSHAMKIIE
jgi:O-antigen/teichoic acid export membrane protein